MENLWKTRTKPKPISNEQYKKALETHMDIDSDKINSKTKDNQKIHSIEDNIIIFKHWYVNKYIICEMKITNIK